MMDGSARFKESSKDTAPIKNTHKLEIDTTEKNKNDDDNLLMTEKNMKEDAGMLTNTSVIV